MSDPWSNDFPPTFDVGTPGAGHMHFGQDGSQTLYGPDGVTVLATLDPTNGFTVEKGTITGATIETASSGPRVVLSAATAKQIAFYSGGAVEIAPGLVESNVLTGGTIATLFTGPQTIAGQNPPNIAIQGDGTSQAIELQNPQGDIALQAFNGGVVTVSGGGTFAVDSQGNVNTRSLVIGASGSDGVIQLDNRSALVGATGGPFVWVYGYNGQFHVSTQGVGDELVVKDGGITVNGDVACNTVHINSFDLELLPQGNGVNGVASVYIANQGANASTVGTGGSLYVLNGALTYRSPAGNIRTVAAN